MKQYIIEPSLIDGYSIIASKNKVDYPKGNFKLNDLVLEIDSYDYHLNLFISNEPNHYFVTNLFKEQIESDNLLDLQFRPLDHLVVGENLKYNFPDHGLTKESFWKIEFSKTPSSMYPQDGELIVSQTCLDYLIKHKAFKDIIEGSQYGKEFEVLSNRFLIEGEVDNFIRNRLPEERKLLADKRKMIMAEYRKESGLPPLEE